MGPVESANDLLGDFHAYHVASSKLHEFEAVNMRRLELTRTVAHLVTVLQLIEESEHKHSQTVAELAQTRKAIKQKQQNPLTARSAVPRVSRPPLKSSIPVSTTPRRPSPTKLGTPLSARVSTPLSVRKNLLKVVKTPQLTPAKTTSIFDDDEDGDDALPDLQTVSRPKVQLKRKAVEYSAPDSSPSKENDDEHTSPIYKRIKQTQEKHTAVYQPSNVFSPVKNRNEGFKNSIFGR
ncbi:hypothetical protein OGAPHI_001674 [Ogataea philodendri]|uniref:Uncharacterized protein n=1 Tax=Ogataea philodendri TaxID=1378263 RepID=A0A9P8T7E2_9ASCO|nr:uncharacterized protein OGAPHI_001674 [Ogataea philodendri]KAH3669078.1 hypothetical protein OGAPHI_001674 [Ogataea philodendri]